MSWLLFIIIIIGLMLLPLLVEKIVVDGIGIVLFTTQFENELWFSFWGSYLGAIITIVVLFITIQYNKKETNNRLKEYYIDRKYDLVVEQIDKLYNFILLKETDDTHNVYGIRLNAKMYQLMVQKCKDVTGECKFYVIYLETLLKYLECTKQFDNVTLTSENIAQYAEKYKLISKELTKIMHSAKDEIDLEYSILKEAIELKRKTDKEQLYKLNSIKELFVRKKNSKI